MQIVKYPIQQKGGGKAKTKNARIGKDKNVSNWGIWILRPTNFLKSFFAFIFLHNLGGDFSTWISILNQTHSRSLTLSCFCPFSVIDRSSLWSSEYIWCSTVWNVTKSGQNFKRIILNGTFESCLFSWVWQKMCYWANFHCCKWPKIEKKSYNHLVTLLAYLSDPTNKYASIVSQCKSEAISGLISVSSSYS